MKSKRTDEEGGRGTRGAEKVVWVEKIIKLGYLLKQKKKREG